MTCSGEPLKKVSRMWRSAERLARSGRDLRQIDIAGTLLLVADVALLFHDAERGAHGGIAGGVGHGGLDFGGGGAAAGDEDIHDLALAAGAVKMLII